MSPDIARELDRILSEPASSVVARERHTLDRMFEESNGRVVLFGAGGLGTHALACLREHGTEPLAFSDNNRSLWGSRVGGIDVLSPNEAAARFGADALFIVTIWNPYHWYIETRRQLENLQCRRVVPASPVYWRFPEQFLPFYAQDLPHKVISQADDVVAAAAIWSDDRSRDEYLQQVSWRVNGCWTFTRPPDRESYFLPDVFDLRADEVFVDCGAFDGDTLRAYLSHQPTFRQFVAIEPDETTYAKLSLYVSGLSPEIRHRVTALHCAVGAERTLISFQADGSLSSRISHGSQESQVLCLPIEELALSRPVTFIKMDIEGAELDALRGARRIIERDRPLLAICVYHSQSDLWQIPLLMKNMASEYRMYLRCHEGDGWQTVAYAVPHERACRWPVP